MRKMLQSHGNGKKSRSSFISLSHFYLLNVSLPNDFFLIKKVTLIKVKPKRK